jgi:hypothetical protein
VSDDIIENTRYSKLGAAIGAPSVSQTKPQLTATNYNKIDFETNKYYRYNFN